MSLQDSSTHGTHRYDSLPTASTQRHDSFDEAEEEFGIEDD